MGLGEIWETWRKIRCWFGYHDSTIISPEYPEGKCNICDRTSIYSKELRIDE